MQQTTQPSNNTPVPIFSYNRAWLVLLYCAFMVAVSALEAVGRPKLTFRGMFLNTLAIVAGAAAATMAYALVVVMRVEPWWQPQYLIPILGMVLGNTITGISVGLGTIVDELSSGADRVERLLALGATRWEAARAPVARAVRLAMTPLLNQMSVVGLVSIPGESEEGEEGVCVFEVVAVFKCELPCVLPSLCWSQTEWRAPQPSPSSLPHHHPPIHHKA